MGNQANGLLSPFLRKQRIEAVLPYLKGKILDYGCGVGYLSSYIDKENYTWVDIDEVSINIAREKYKGYVFYNLSEFKNIKEKYDVISCLAVIEHVKEPSELLKYFRDIIKIDGYIIITTPNPIFDIFHKIGAVFGLFSKEASEEHNILINKQNMIKLLSNLDMKIIKYKKFLLGANQLFVIGKNNI